MDKIRRSMIAPCGIDCGVCLAHLRKENRCAGCRDDSRPKPKTRTLCRIKSCTSREGKFCFACKTFPCERLVRLDNRYRKKYGMSEIENLMSIKKTGIVNFVRSERKKWQSKEGTLCVHDRKRY
jgi:hypothetical protein